MSTDAGVAVLFGESRIVIETPMSGGREGLDSGGRGAYLQEAS
jgi:hypothetical protein